MRAILLMSLAVFSAADQAVERWFPAGEPELVTADSEASLSRRWSWEEYAKTTEPLKGRPRIVVLQERPALSSAATFGVNFSFGGRNRSYAVDGSDADGYLLYVDVDGNGKLGDDEKFRMQKADGQYSSVIEQRVEDASGGATETYLVRIRATLGDAVPPEGGAKVPVLKIFGRSIRKGVVQLGALRVPFALVGRAGLYDQPGNEVIFDVDGRGLRLDQNGAPNRYQVSEGRVTLGGAAYRFHVDRFGRALALTPVSSPLPERPSLDAGTVAPAFTFRDLEGRDHQLSDYRGKVVLVVFWATWCGPCRAEAPQIADLLQKYGRDGLVIVGVNPNDALADIQSFVTQYHVAWPTAREPLDGPIHKMFRIDAWPTHILIGKDGRIVANRVSVGEIAALVSVAIR
jgi:thiol-disulfide isomerase/thioredoxin